MIVSDIKYSYLELNGPTHIKMRYPDGLVFFAGNMLVISLT